MQENEFNQKVDDTLMAIEEAVESCVENSDADLDWDLANGILTIECGDDCKYSGSQVIINRQGPTQQIWVATKGGGFHFNFCEGDDANNNGWFQDDLELFALLDQALSDQTGETVKLR